MAKAALLPFVLTVRTMVEMSGFRPPDEAIASPILACPHAERLGNWGGDWRS